MNGAIPAPRRSSVSTACRGTAAAAQAGRGAAVPAGFRCLFARSCAGRPLVLGSAVEHRDARRRRRRDGARSASRTRSGSAKAGGRLVLGLSAETARLVRQAVLLDRPCTCRRRERSNVRKDSGRTARSQTFEEALADGNADSRQAPRQILEERAARTPRRRRPPRRTLAVPLPPERSRDRVGELATPTPEGAAVPTLLVVAGRDRTSRARKTSSGCAHASAWRSSPSPAATSSSGTPFEETATAVESFLKGRARGCGRRGRSRPARPRGRGRVLPVEDRVHLDDLERVEEARLGHELHRQVRLAVGEPPRTGVPTPGATSGSMTSMSSETWTKAAPRARSNASRRPPRSRAGRSRSSCRRRPRGSRTSALALVERADADERDPPGRARAAATPRSRISPRARAPRRAASRARCRSASSPGVQVAVRVEPEDAGRRRAATPSLRASRARPSGRRRARAGRAVRTARPTGGDALARLLDLRQESAVSRGLRRLRSPCRRSPSRGGRSPARRVARRGRRSGSPTAPCRRRGGRRRGRAQHR